jgi:hypothetical protein
MIQRSEPYFHRNVLTGPIQGEPGAPGVSVSSVSVTALAYGEPATASFNAATGALALGIPAGAPADALDFDRILTVDDEVLVVDGNILNV